MITRYKKKQGNEPEPLILSQAVIRHNEVRNRGKKRPFSLYFITRSDGGKTHSFNQFTENETEVFEGMLPGISTPENQDIAVYFDAPADFRLTMDGLDVISLPKIEKIEGESYIKPMGRSHAPLLLFEGKDFPLVPGYYVITVSGGGKTWYGIFEITPKFMGKQSWQDMRDELVEEIRHISFDFMKTNIHISKSMENILGLESDMLLRFYTINNESERVLKVLSELSHTANARLILSQERILSDRNRDTQILHGGVRVEKSGAPYQYVNKTKITWDVAENRFAKAILQRLDWNLAHFVKKIDGHVGRLEKKRETTKLYGRSPEFCREEKALIHLENYRKRAMVLRGAIRMVADAPWFQETKGIMPKTIPMIVFRDPRYAVIYRLYRNLKHPKDSLSISSFYQFQWKRTDKLYELWCFLQFIKALYAKDWEFKQGPAVIEENGRYRLSGLDVGTEIILCRKGDHIRLVYDGLVPASSSETSREKEPLYTNNTHRRPDFRMDYYKGNEYYGSLVADFKYRDIYFLWRDSERSAGIRAQFNSYRDMNTKYYQGMDENTSLRNSRPVKEVWAIFPKEIPDGSDEDFNLKFISLAPGLSSNEKLQDMLENYIQSLG